MNDSSHIRQEIEAHLQRQRCYQEGGYTRSVSKRLDRLARLAEVLKSYEPDIMVALRQDLNKSELESYTTELGIVLEEIRHIRRRLRRWVKPRKVKTALTHVGSKGYIVPEPYGTVLIIAPWNYPFQLAVSPLVGAIAAGNTVVLKPSELAPAMSALLKRVLGEVFSEDEVVVLEGGVEVSTALLEQKFDYIFFTGSVNVGRIVMEAASKHLTPVTLELGGKSPCIVHYDADVKLAARRIAFGKFTNAGQTCVAPDYLWVHKDIKEELLSELKIAVQSFYGERPLQHPDYGRIVSRRHFDRLVSFTGNGRIVMGGDSDEELLKIEPTVIDQVTWDMPMMKEEIFGPVFPVMEYDSLDQVIQGVRSHPKPLALYLFSESRSVQQQVTESLSFGGGTINDTLMHLATPYLPFGGVGESGMGSYHGYESFKTFSHEKSVLVQTTRFDFTFRYPSSKHALKIMKKLLK
ncbi:aldehyde dehydrogenase [Paenibacillus sp. J22TS3]|uniref:aldehyde dehydrogenase n=1 Tax=Paenibacillus sp. J22TS3 TaxID=2807192 RepID=UPI001B21A5F8|nr:aldehyde dehydrogenase [Paenibacillus sp. J22TS3]GIP22646.1 putative aldehyde dehydrogenase YwdH [Paenibacillus sp. J22TS3]